MLQFFLIVRGQCFSLGRYQTDDISLIYFFLSQKQTKPKIIKMYFKNHNIFDILWSTYGEKTSVSFFWVGPHRTKSNMMFHCIVSNEPDTFGDVFRNIWLIAL